MILAGAAGFLLQQFTPLEHAVVPAILAGMVVAMFVPSKTACRVDLSQRPAAAVDPTQDPSRLDSSESGAAHQDSTP